MTERFKKLIDGTFDEENKRIYFWNGVFSQWHRIEIYDPIHNVNANCAEQLMMLNKALLFNDRDSAKAILATNSPREQKQLGRNVKGYDESIWSQNRLEIVSDINYFKFTQHKLLKDILVASKDYELVEASPYDKIWGIGLHQNDEDVKDKSKWKGLNLLGIALMNARKRILDERI